MKKIYFIIFISTFSLGLQAQTNINFKKIDRYALKTPKSVRTSIPQLSQYLTQPYDEDLAKVRSIFTWMVHNIDYDKQAYNNGNKRLNTSNEDVLKRKKAVCYGYSTLFKALCEASDISAEIVIGYSKGSLTATPEFNQADHAWNAVKIDNQWQLLDVTWASGLLNGSDDFMATLNTNYFLTNPKDLILNHLPADPIWQLLDCIIPIDVFAKNATAIQQYLLTNDNCISYGDTITQYEQLTGLVKRMATEERAYRFNPTPQTAKEYGHTLMDYEGELSDIEETLLGSSHVDSLISLQKEMICLCEKAANLTQLFPNQIENCAYTRINYAVAMSQKVNNVNEEARVMLLKTMKIQTLQAKQELEALTSNFVIQNALQQCEQILEFLK